MFANTSLIHVPSQQLPRVLGKLYAALKLNGVLFCSNPRGNNKESLSGDRIGCFFDLDPLRRYVNAAGCVEVKHYYSPLGLPSHRQPWLATFGAGGGEEPATATRNAAPDH